MTTSIRSMLVILGVALALALEPMPVAQAQVTLDVSKLTCGQLLSYKFTIAEKIGAWASGYHSGKRGSTSLDTHRLVENAKKLRNYCIRNNQTLVMDAIETVLGPAQ